MNEFEPKIIGFLCNWCSYAGADLAGVSRFQYPANIRIIRIPCSGRVNHLFIMRALYDGADGVLISGCHPGDCHYQTGNYYARRRLEIFKNLLYLTGIPQNRLKLAWVSASEGAQFSKLVTEITDDVKELGENEEFRAVRKDIEEFCNEQ
ncbi:MAG TPA: hydrogenase iron-sulfur subunit [Caldisericia bacterium]|nr:hydrogenase iron-sulfur subunit [Caldisericia bacterium]